MFRQRTVQPHEGQLLCAPHQLSIRSKRDGHVHVLQLSGELDKDTAPAFDAELKRVEATDAREIVVDLRSLSFIGSDGLKIFIQANARSRLGGQRLMLVLGHGVRNTFETSGLLSRLPFEDDRKATSPMEGQLPRIQVLVPWPVHEWPGKPG
jgi:stage II sporulation protein AA (anti-sigma F factor antagonist)